MTEKEVRLIDANALKERKVLVYDPFGEESEGVLLEDIDTAPTIEAEPVVHAKWILKDQHGNGVCSHCNRQDNIDPLATHCRYCGAKMDLKDEN